MSRLLEYLPIYERSSIVFQEILNSEQMEFDRLGLNIEELERQFFIDTATWGLAIYEKELKLPIRPKKTLEERRSLIKSKMRGMGKVDLAMIKSIIEAYTRSTADIIFDGRINIKFTNEGTITLNISDMFNAIEEIKPAHLDYEFTLNYKQKLSEIYIASTLVAGEEITVYPYSPKELLSKGNIYIAAGSNTGLEKVIIYPRKEVI